MEVNKIFLDYVESYNLKHNNSIKLLVIIFILNY